MNATISDIPAPVSDIPVYTDFQGLSRLQAEAKQDPAKALGKVARQFEALFIQMMLKSMREAKLADGMFNSDQMQTYMQMFDRQIALTLSNQRSLGVADMLVKQLSGAFAKAKTPAQGGTSTDRQAARQPSPTGVNAPDGTPGAGGQKGPGDIKSFVRTLWPYARKSAETLGVDPTVLLAQAGLETGWGKGTITFPDGRSSHNLFGIKADSSWRGATVASSTLEYKAGGLVKETAPFRAYGSIGESFSDYVNFLKSNPRYQEAVQQAGDPQAFVAGLQSAGYSTDPEYAGKVMAILGSAQFSRAAQGLKDSSDRPLYG